MSERKPEHPAVKIAGAVGAFIFITVLLLAVLVPEQLAIAKWIVIPLAVMGVALGWVASKRRD
jgi:positive regulator of sigma E activity